MWDCLGALSIPLIRALSWAIYTLVYMDTATRNLVSRSVGMRPVMQQHPTCQVCVCACVLHAHTHTLFHAHTHMSVSRLSLPGNRFYCESRASIETNLILPKICVNHANSAIWDAI